MTERNYSKSDNEWVGRVVNVFDPDKDGRVQVRIMGQHDDTVNIPDKDLLWVKPHQDITSAAHNKIGASPVGVIKGSFLRGYYLDSDRQVAVFTGTIASAGDPTSNNILDNGQMNLKKGTNSSPLGHRIANNSFITRKGKSIKEDDSANTYPIEQNDSDGVNITAQAKANTKYGTFPTTASIGNPIGSILSQIKQVDPQNLNAVLPNAVSSYLKIKDLNAVSTSGGINNILGMISSLSSGNSGINISSLSPLMQSIIGKVSGDASFSMIQDLGSMATIGTTLGSILGDVGSVIPQIAPYINLTMNMHLPNSVLDQGIITKALQSFSLNQGFLKYAQDGKKELAINATTSGI